MYLFRTALASALLGAFAMSSFAAMPNPDPAAREARMEEALQHYRAKQEAMARDSTQTKVSDHKKHRRHHHAAKQRAAKQDDNAKAKDQTQ
jgi:hypothetical protein